MARWTKRCNEFVDVRELIDAEDYNGILKKLSEICDKYANVKFAINTQMKTGIMPTIF